MNVRIFLPFALLLITACEPVTTTVQTGSAPAPSSVEAPKPSAQPSTEFVGSRVVSVPLDSVFPKVLNVLMNNGYIIRYADKNLGIVSFYRQWADGNEMKASFVQEGSATFNLVDQNSTQVRLIITGSWQRIESSFGGKNMFGDRAMLKVEQTVNPWEYTKLFDLLEQGLSSNHK